MILLQEYFKHVANILIAKLLLDAFGWRNGNRLSSLFLQLFCVLAFLWHWVLHFPMMIQMKSIFSW